MCIRDREAGEEVLARHSPGEAGEEVLARHSPGEAGEDGPARRSQSCGRRASFCQGGNPPDAGLSPSSPAVPDAYDTVGHRQSTILKGFPMHRAREKICPMLASLRASGRNLPGRKIRPTPEVHKNDLLTKTSESSAIGGTKCTKSNFANHNYAWLCPWSVCGYTHNLCRPITAH